MTAKRFRPHHISLGIGIGFAVVTVASGIVGAALACHDDSPERPTVFGNIPGALELAFYMVLAVLIVYGAVHVREPGEELGAGQARQPRDHRRRTSSGASRDFRAGVYMQTLLRDPAAGIMHSLIYFRS